MTKLLAHYIEKMQAYVLKFTRFTFIVSIIKNFLLFTTNSNLIYIHYLFSYFIENYFLVSKILKSVLNIKQKYKPIKLLLCKASMKTRS